MKKIFFLCVVSVLILSANTRSLISKIPPAQNIIIDMYDGDECDQRCVEDLYTKEQYFSFLSQYKDNDTDERMKYDFRELQFTLNIKDAKFMEISNLDFIKFQSDPGLLSRA